MEVYGSQDLRTIPYWWLMMLWIPQTIRASYTSSNMMTSTEWKPEFPVRLGQFLDQTTPSTKVIQASQRSLGTVPLLRLILHYISNSRLRMTHSNSLKEFKTMELGKHIWPMPTLISLARTYFQSSMVSVSSSTRMRLSTWRAPIDSSMVNNMSKMFCSVMQTCNRSRFFPCIYQVVLPMTLLLTIPLQA